MSNDLETLNLVELYNLLVLPDAPAPVSMWPQTAGWIWLGLAMFLLVGLGVWRLVVWHRATAYRREALAALRAAGDDPVAISAILRRTALAVFSRDAVAGLQGAEWLEFLDVTSNSANFTRSDAGRVLAKAPFSPQTPHKDLPAMAEAWIRTHHLAEPTS
ncbi:DUF4381 domain-containing protein [Pseudophaeobacter sp. EL27]|uniref:DUF4381 domain-containing protein n=1 Tax=Pseudophaeobacter sp. EL27 TaxID=2107580 RepID=UPI000EFA83D4|nr:DUF4381 domain-containing protein [Pseudophaeobacter sp. EL27]